MAKLEGWPWSRGMTVDVVPRKGTGLRVPGQGVETVKGTSGATGVFQAVPQDGVCQRGDLSAGIWKPNIESTLESPAVTSGWTVVA